MKTSLVGFGGPKEHGKDSLAGFLADSSDTVVMGMSDRLLDAFVQLNPLIMVLPGYGIRAVDGSRLQGLMRGATLVKLAGFVEAKRVPEVRTMLITLGTGIVRDIAPNAWVDHMSNRIQGELSAGRKVLVTGIRFPNELAMVRDLGGSTIWVERPGHPVSGDRSDATEHSLSAEDFDMLVLNNATLTELEAKAQLIRSDIPGLCTPRLTDT